MNRNTPPQGATGTAVVARAIHAGASSTPTPRVSNAPDAGRVTVPNAVQPSKATIST